ncbi:MAG: DNA repair exonuclease [Hyphomicrobiaceae bacterium]|nr:DNA repair exonuclease [Hyphomicrobiaceae bacterium]
MTFTFIHTADWQLGKTFAGLPAEKVPLLREARLDAIGRIAAVGRSQGARHALVAGDIYDSRDVADRDLLQSLERLRREQDVTWHLLPGNHDPVQAGGVWERLTRFGVPANVRLHLEPHPQMIAADIALLPAPLTARTAAGDPTAWMDAAATPLARHRIGLAHGSIQGFGGEMGEAAVPIAPGRAETAGLDYLALGDWHGATRISDRVWYSGTPEPDRFPDNEPGFVLVVRIEGQGSPAMVERRPTAQYTWWKRALAITGPESLAIFGQSLEAAVAQPERLLLRLALGGTATLSTWSEAESRLAALEQSLFHLVVDSTALQVLPEDIELEEFGAGDLRRVAELLTTTARDAASEKAPAASLALRKLYLLRQSSRAGESS